jgi:hypothetical protein
LIGYKCLSIKAIVMTTKKLKYKPLAWILMNPNVNWNDMTEEQIVETLKTANDLDLFVILLCRKLNIYYESN